LITLGQVVWVAERHPPVDGVIPSDTDAKRRLEAYIAVELGTNANEQARKHAKAALDLAVGLQHKRSATCRGNVPGGDRFGSQAGYDRGGEA
jgi:hypothetical protein